MIYNGIDRRSKAKVFGCLEMNYRDVGLFFHEIFEAIEEEKDKMKVTEIIDVKNGKPIEKEIEFDEQQARIEYDDIFDPESEQHYSKERIDR